MGCSASGVFLIDAIFRKTRYSLLSILDACIRKLNALLTIMDPSLFNLRWVRKIQENGFLITLEKNLEWVVCIGFHYEKKFVHFFLRLLSNDFTSDFKFKLCVKFSGLFNPSVI